MKRTLGQIIDEFGGAPADWSTTETTGWIHRDAEIDPGVIVGPEAVIRGGEFWGGEFWGGTFWGGEFWGGTFRGGTFWGGEFWGGEFWGGTFRGGEFRGGEFWGGEFWGGEILGGTWHKEPLFIQGTRHPATNAKPGCIKIGCRCETFAWWLSPEAETFARENGYSDAEIAEYRAIVELFTKIGV